MVDHVFDRCGVAGIEAFRQLLFRNAETSADQCLFAGEFVDRGLTASRQRPLHSSDNWRQTRFSFSLNVVERFKGRSGSRVGGTVQICELSIRKFTPTGRMTEHTFKTLWARFFVQRHEEFGITSMAVAGEGRQTDIGSFLNPDDRESFAKAMTGALATAKQRI